LYYITICTDFSSSCGTANGVTEFCPSGHAPALKRKYKYQIQLHGLQLSIVYALWILKYSECRKELPAIMGVILIKWHAQNWVSYNERLERWQLIISWYTSLLTDLQKVSHVRHHVVYLNKITETKESEIWETKLGSSFLSIMASMKPWLPKGNIFRKKSL